MFDFEGIQGHQRRFITWLLEECAPEVNPADILAPDALEVLAERTATRRLLLKRLVPIVRIFFWVASPST